MKLSNITKSISNFGQKVLFTTKQKSPELLLIASIVTGAGCVGAACWATLKSKDEIEMCKREVGRLEMAASSMEIEPEDAEKLRREEKRVTLIATGRVAKYFTPAVVLGCASIGASVGSNVILMKRCASLGAAYTAVVESFEQYRKRVAEKWGEDAEKAIRYGLSEQTLVETIIDPDTGEEKQIVENVQVVDPNLKSGYAVYFDKRSGSFKSKAEYNFFFIHCQQQYANDLLHARGYLFWNEVLESLDLPLDPKGQEVGWIYDPENPDKDNYVNLRATEVYRQTESGDMEKVIVLDPNLDGGVLNEFQKKLKKGEIR